MKLAMSNIAWNDNHECYYDLMKNYGFSGLEIAPTKFSINPYDNLEVAKDIKTSLKNKYNFLIVSMQSLLFGTKNLDLFSSLETRNNLKSYLKKAIVYAEVISCPVLVFGNPKNRIMLDNLRDYSIAVEFFYELGEFAKLYNTCLCIEPNPEVYGTNFINTIEQANQLVNDVNSQGFAMIIDTSTMLVNNNKPMDIVSVMNNVKHIHISMPFLKLLNKEFKNYELWLRKFIETIYKSHYNKFISIEMINAAREDIELSLKQLKNLVDETIIFCEG